MPLTRTLELVIGNYNIDLGDLNDLKFKYSWQLEEPENFTSKQGADPLTIRVPATTNNDKAFNQFWNPAAEDLAPAALSFRELMPYVFNINGTIPIQVGYAVLEGASATDQPQYYDLSVFSANGLWTVDLQTVTLWDCVNPNDHTFDVGTVQGSWSGYSGDNDNDFVYAPVRYRQPFDGTTLGFGGDNCVNIYHLRPSISLKRLIERAFALIGVTIKSQFMSTNYFKNLVLPWVWGDFYDLDSQLVLGMGFQACGKITGIALPPEISNNSTYNLAYWVGDPVGGPVSEWRVETLDTLPGYGGVRPGDYDFSTFPRAEVDHGIEYNTRVGVATDLAIVIGGTGYTVGDVITLTPHRGTAITVTVGAVGGSGNVTAFLVGGFSGGDPSSEGYAAGKTVATTGGTGTGLTVKILKNSVFKPTIVGGSGLGGTYLFTGNTPQPIFKYFDMSDTSVPEGYDNFLLYSFDPATGTMQYTFNVPPSLMGSVNNIGINFLLSMYASYGAGASRNSVLGLEIIKTDLAGHDISNCYSTKDDGRFVSNAIYPAAGAPYTPTAFKFTVPNCNSGDVIKMRLVFLTDNDASAMANGYFCQYLDAFYLNNNPPVLGVASYTYNTVTQSFSFITPNAIWSPVYSKLSMTGFLVQLGNTVNLKNYDAFRNYQFLDMLGGVVDMFNLEIVTDQVSKIVSIEPMFGGTLPTGELYDGHFSKKKILDWTEKLDNSKENKVTLFNSANRQIDLTFKLDGNDGGQNIWAQRYKGIYLSNRTYTGGINQNNINIDNGIIAGIPGAARFMLPNRFAKGNQQMSNRFFSAVMHVSMAQWKDLNGVGTSPATQLIAIFPQDQNSDTAYKDTFTPKLAWYAGSDLLTSQTGAWLWIGDPADPIPTTVQKLPFMFAVNYLSGQQMPKLNYCDENILGNRYDGLMSQFYRQRYAIMRNGQYVTMNLRLNLNDVCNWFHQELIMIDRQLYALIGINGYDPLSDDSTECTLYKIALPTVEDVTNSFPSNASVLSVNPATLLGQYDLRYGPTLLYNTDCPQVS